ncbi:ribbon-helix-helix protein, CopG family [Fervidibacter sacchari]|jgi:Ribbon-helix-helix protein, copG family.
MAGKTVTIVLDDELDAALEEICLEQGRTKGDLIVELLRKFVEDERLRLDLNSSELTELYQALVNEDVALAEEGMADYHRMLKETDES